MKIDDFIKILKDYKKQGCEYVGFYEDYVSKCYNEAIYEVKDFLLVNERDFIEQVKKDDLTRTDENLGSFISCLSEGSCKKLIIYPKEFSSDYDYE